MKGPFVLLLGPRIGSWLDYHYVRVDYIVTDLEGRNDEYLSAVTEHSTHVVAFSTLLSFFPNLIKPYTFYEVLI
jgi:hypothetical protein